jgi:TonB family protein
VLKQAQETARQEGLLREAETQARKEEERKRLEAEQAARNETEARVKAEAETQTQAQEAEKAKVEADLARQRQEIELGRKQLELDQAKQQARSANQIPVQRLSPDAPAKFLKPAEYRYPSQAIKNGADPAQEYIVHVTALIDVTGRVIDVTSLSGPPPAYGFNQVALDVVRRSTFSPAMKSGKPVSSSLTLNIKFKPLLTK